MILHVYITLDNSSHGVSIVGLFFIIIQSRTVFHHGSWLTTEFDNILKSSANCKGEIIFQRDSESAGEQLSRENPTGLRNPQINIRLILQGLIKLVSETYSKIKG